MSTIHTETAGRTSDRLDSSRGRWPLIGAAAGITGFIATLVTDVHVNGDDNATAAYCSPDNPKYGRRVLSGTVDGF